MNTLTRLVMALIWFTFVALINLIPKNKHIGMKIIGYSALGLGLIVLIFIILITIPLFIS